MAKSKATILRETQAHEMQKIEYARLVYESLTTTDDDDSWDMDDDDEDDDEEWKKPRKSGSMGVGDDGEILCKQQIKMLALQVMKKGLEKLIKE